MPIYNPNTAPSVILSVVSKTTTYTAATSDDVILVDTSGGAWTLTLYAASGNSGKVLTIKKTSSDVNALTIDGNLSETIDGQTTTTLNTQYESIRIICDGTNWHILERKIDSTTKTYTPTGSWSNVTYAGAWNRDDDVMNVDIQATLLGTPTSATLTISLPSGYTIDTAKLANSTIYDAGLGNVHIRDYTENFYTGSVRYNDTTSVLFTINAGGLVTQSVPMTWDAADQLSAKFSVPIVGWKGN